MSLGRSSSMARGFVRVDREIELREENARLRETLESICGNRCARGLNPCEAREALDKHEGKK